MTASFDYLPGLLTALQADTTLTTALTGGIYLKRSLPRGGMTRELLPAAYSSSKQMLPLLIIRGRAVVPAGARDMDKQYHATRQAVEFWFYQDGDAGYSTLRTAANRVYALLDQKHYAGSVKWLFVNEIEERAAEYNNAALIMQEYALIGSRKVS